jgi:hypothetical protein
MRKCKAHGRGHYRNKGGPTQGGTQALLNFR